MSETVIRIQPIGARSPMVPDERCPRTCKRRFPTLEAAETALAHWSKDTTWDGSAFACCYCGGYHLTHREQQV